MLLTATIGYVGRPVPAGAIPRRLVLVLVVDAAPTTTAAVAGVEPGGVARNPVRGPAVVPVHLRGDQPVVECSALACRLVTHTLARVVAVAIFVFERAVVCEF